MRLSTIRPNPLRYWPIVAGSIAAHGLLLAILALPRIEGFIDRSNNEGAVIVTLERALRTPALPAVAVAAGAPNVLQPRSPRTVFRSSVAPLVVPGLSAIPARRSALHPAPWPEGAGGDLRTALRGSSVGCANAAAMGLNRAEQARCDERWGQAARKAPQYADAPMDPRKRADFDQVAAGQAAHRRYLEAPMGPGVDHRSRDGPGQPKDIPFVMGDTDGLGRKKSDQSLGVRR